MAIDSEGKRLYYSDSGAGRYFIASVDMDGANHRTLIRDLTYPRAVVLVPQIRYDLLT